MFEDEEYRNRSISTRIKYFMKKEKLSQPKLGAAIGCSRDTIFSYANAKIPAYEYTVVEKNGVIFWCRRILFL